MEDIVPALLEEIQKDFNDTIKRDTVLKGLLEKINSKKATYIEANEYAIRAGEILRDIYQKHITADVLPDGRMYYNIAKRILEPTLKRNYELVTEATEIIQNALNESAGFGLKAIKPELNMDRIDGIVNKVSAEKQYADVAWMLGEPVVNFTQSIVDDSIKCNSEFQGKSGMSPKIVRTLAGGCCEWCTDIAGTYIYPNVPEDVYRRHDRCKCRVEYIPSKGKRVTVHSGKEGKRKYVKDKRGNYVKTKESRIQHAKEMELTRAERQKAAREKRIDTWKKKTEKDKSLSNPIGENTSDVTRLYLKTAKPGHGEIITEHDYNTKNHEDELNTAKWLKKNFGGNIKLCAESTEIGKKTPDYIWRETTWELKNVSTKNSIGDRIRKAVKQIDDGGGIIIDISNRKISQQEAIDEIIKRLEYRADKNIDLIIKEDESFLKAIRYKK